MEQLKARLKAYAREVGLDLAGIAPAHPFQAEQTLLQGRKDAGLGPNPFEWQEIDPRVLPDQLLPGVQSIIAGGISYLMDDEPPGTDSPPLKGWLSRYCRGQDYHQLLKAKLNLVAQWLEAQAPGTRTLVYVDTGPPLDRAVAERAGIGKWGKHTNLITPEFGTWVFLGEILTDLPLPPDEPMVEACGSCRLCLDACPTQCLTEWNLDANRCLSYVTQMKGIIPLEYREVMGNRLFGCDDCQDVCPYNKKAQRGLHQEFAPVPDLGPTPDLQKLLTMTKGEFRRWFQPTAAGWRGKTTIVRNTLIALGNSGDPRALEPLKSTLTGESPTVRAHAAWALGRLARQAPGTTAAAKAALLHLQQTEQDASVLLEVSNALERLGQATAT